MTHDAGTSPPRSTSLGELAALFFRLGLTAFGGPAAHVAMMEAEVVRRRGWMTREEFLDLYGATNLIPGPNSTELAIHIGHRRAGALGLVVAGASFILPAAAVTLGIAWLYARFGAVPKAEGLLYGVKPVIIGVVAQALVGLARSAMKTKLLGAVAIASVAASLVGVNELAVVVGGGVVVAAARALARRDPPPIAALLQLGKTAGAGGVAAAVATPFGLLPLFLFFLKVGAVLFGSGYVLLAYLRSDLVDRLHWLTEAQLLDAVAVGQITPGPVFTTATFIGYVLGGLPGAALATLGIFLPSFFFVAVSGPLVPRIRSSAGAGAFLDGVNSASLALMAVVTFQLGRAALVDLPAAALAGLSAFLLIRFRVNSIWLVLGGGAVGLALHWLR